MAFRALGCVQEAQAPEFLSPWLPAWDMLVHVWLRLCFGTCLVLCSSKRTSMRPRVRTSVPSGPVVARLLPGPHCFPCPSPNTGPRFQLNTATAAPAPAPSATRSVVSSGAQTTLFMRFATDKDTKEAVKKTFGPRSQGTHAWEAYCAARGLDPLQNNPVRDAQAAGCEPFVLPASRKLSPLALLFLVATCTPFPPSQYVAQWQIKPVLEGTTKRLQASLAVPGANRAGAGAGVSAGGPGPKKRGSKRELTKAVTGAAVAAAPAFVANVAAAAPAERAGPEPAARSDDDDGDGEDGGRRFRRRIDSDGEDPVPSPLSAEPVLAAPSVLDSAPAALRDADALLSALDEF
jgi:hypothetical protein